MKKPVAVASPTSSEYFPLPDWPLFRLEADEVLADAALEPAAIEYQYGLAVKLAGHLCPTVGGAWRMTPKALARLYPDATPQRGGMQVELRQAAEEGVAGVIASIADLITGAANEGGFEGFAGRFGRQGLL